MSSEQSLTEVGASRAGKGLQPGQAREGPTYLAKNCCERIIFPMEQLEPPTV